MIVYRHVCLIYAPYNNIQVAKKFSKFEVEIPSLPISCPSGRFEDHKNGAEVMQIVTPLYNFNDLCGPLGQLMADDGRVGTLRVSTVKNLDSLDEDVMVKQVLDGMMRKCGSQEERHTWLLKWKPLAEQAL